jgi:hypothetical protein
LNFDVIARGIAPKQSLFEGGIFMAEERHEDFPAPGVMVLIIIFFVSFVMFYFLNWKWLSMVWNIG